MGKCPSGRLVHMTASMLYRVLDNTINDQAGMQKSRGGPVGEPILAPPKTINSPDCYSNRKSPWEIVPMPVYELEGESPTLPGEGRYWVAPNAAVIGKVTLDEDVSIWFGAVLRGDNEPIRLGRGTNIQEHVMIHTDPHFPCTVGPDCTIGHRAILHGCTLGTNCLVGMGAIVLNGAKIGDNCLIGAGALVSEGREIPDNSLVLGMPGKIVREVTEDQIAMIKRAGASYAARWKRYASELKEL